MNKPDTENQPGLKSKPDFEGQFTQQESLPEEAIERAVAIMRSGRLHRYNVSAGETSETALLEQEFAKYLGTEYCLACTSGGYAMNIALRAWGLEPGEPVLTNAFTLSPVPGSIHGAGGKPVLVETTDQLVIDLDDLEAKIHSSGAKVLMLSHMRGHLVDMDALMALLDKTGVALIEDCAHTMGAFWGNRPSGTFGVVSCFSTQTYKHINSGEGGFLVSNDPAIMSRATILSGSYMLYDRHTAGPTEEHYDETRYQMPNLSGRMDNLRAALLRPQLLNLPENCKRWNNLHDTLAAELGKHQGFFIPKRDKKESYVGSSFQFLIPDYNETKAIAFVKRCGERGVELKWFGAEEPAGYTSNYRSWRYMDTSPALPHTDSIMATLFDIRLPLTFSEDDAVLIGQIIVSEYQ